MRVRSARETHMGELYGELRPLMFSIAYRLVGSVGDAEDIVQEAFLRFHRASTDGQEIESPKAYVSAITTRLAIDHLRSARVRRERYVGTWLPEPVLTDPESDVALHAETADSLSMAFLVLLESLSPTERAVFLLREVFEYGYDEIARVIGKSEDNCRQIAVRARRQVEEKRPRFEASRTRREELAHRFFDAIGEGDAQGLLDLLAADVTRSPACCSARRPEGNASGYPAPPTSRSTGSPAPCSSTVRGDSSRRSRWTSPTTSSRRCARSRTPTSCST